MESRSKQPPGTSLMLSIKHLFSRLQGLKAAKIPLVNQYRLKGMIGMTWMSEREWWFGYASNKFTGRGAMVDLGCWFGSTTASLAEGLSKNADKKAQDTRIQAFDRFVWEDWMEFSVKGTPTKADSGQATTFRESSWI